MRKYISIIVLFILLFNIGGDYLWYCVIQYGIQNEVAKEIGENSKDYDLTLIIMPVKDASGIVWIKPDKEFFYKGEMYDVVKIQNHQLKNYYYCLNDSKERQLIANFTKTSNHKKELEKKLKRNFNYSLYFQRYSISKNLYPINLTFTAVNILYKSTIVDILYPPPKSA